MWPINRPDRRKRTRTDALPHHGCIAKAMRTLWAIAAAAAALPTTMGQQRRRLSRSDGVKWRGTLNSSAIVNKYLYVFVHIPKNAGASFMKDSRDTYLEELY